MVGLLAICSSAHAKFIPGDVASVGLTNIVPDVALWYNSANYFTNGPVNLAAQVASLGTWEPYLGLLSDSTFLISANTFVDDGTASNMRTALAFQPAAGGPPKLSTMFYDDSGFPYTNKHHEFPPPQSGALSRVAGDKRYGAKNFIGGGSVALYNYPTFFNSDGRFDVNSPFYSTLAASSGGGREACVQIHSLNPSTLAQTPLSKAFDSAFGRCCTNASYPATTEKWLTRYGGHLQGLSDGNFVSVVEDHSLLFNPSGNASLATIFRPDGSVVKESFKVADADQWANVAAFKGGFSVRPSGGVFYFYDNAGNLIATNIQNASSGLVYDTGRGDGTRTASDIRSQYVYLAGVAGGTNVMLSVWKAQTGAWITNAVVSETDPSVHALDRVDIAVDALDRICVVYKLKPVAADFPFFQVAARVLKFDGTNVTYLTASFFPFINHDEVGINGFETVEPSVAMTTREICISAKGTINSTNNPTGGADTWPQTDLYTVISHPAPVSTPRPNITITDSGGNATISWNADDGLFTLQKTSTLSPAAWSDVSPQPAIVPAAGNLNTMTVAIGSGNLFFRLAR